MHGDTAFSSKKTNSGFSGKCVDLQKIVLRETTQTQKDKHSMFFLILASSPQEGVYNMQ